MFIEYELFRKVRGTDVFLLFCCCVNVILLQHVDAVRDLPDCIIICDEGHRLKNSSGNQTIRALNSMRTRRGLKVTECIANNQNHA